jgi:AcrR family transcriptional regulator
LTSKKEETKKKILEVTGALLDLVENPDEITIRRIAERAGIGVGLINYHFTSREKLMNEAISAKIESLAGVLENINEYKDDPLNYLKEMLINMSDSAMKNRRLNRISAEYDLLKGDFKICLYLLPILRKIFMHRRSETELRLIAFQIIVTTQSIYLRQDAFHMLTGINIEIKGERDSLINSIVDNLIK